MKNIFSKLCVLATVSTLSINVWADTETIPLSLDSYLTTSNAATTGTINNNDNGNLGSINKGATATFTLTNASAQEMVLCFLTGNNNNSNPTVTVTLNDGSSDFFTTGAVAIENTGSWTPVTKHVFDVGTIPAGTITLKFEFNNSSSYVCNLGSIGLYNKASYIATLDAMPGDITLANGTYHTARVEGGGNVGYCSNGATAAYMLYNPTRGLASLNMGLVYYGDGTLNVKIKDFTTGETEIDTDITINSSVCKGYDTPVSFELGDVSAGFKVMTFTVSTAASYLCNYKNVSLSMSWKDIAIDLRSGQLGTSGSNLQKYLTIDANGAYNYADAEPAEYNAILKASSYNGSDHGYVGFKANVALPAGIYKITLGTCQFGTGTGYIKNSDESSTLTFIDALGQEVTSFNQNTGVCYHNNTATNIISLWYEAESAETITIVCGNYTPYIAIERVDELPELMYSVTFVNDTEGVTGTVPDYTILTPGESISLPINHTLYKEDYTLTGWNDGADTYAIGETYTPTANTTLTAVFTANVYSLSESVEDITVRWDFQRQNGAPEVQWQNRSSDFLVTQAEVNGRRIDVKMDINTTSGKFNNAGWTDWAQVNEGTTLSFPALTGSEVKAYSMNEPKNGSSVKSFVDDDNEYSSYSSYIATYATTPSDGVSTLTVKGGGYYRYVDVTYPASTATLPLSSLVIDSIAPSNIILADINNGALYYTATLTGNIYTTVPVVKATFSDAATATAVVSGEGDTRTYTFNHTIGGTPYTFVLNIEGISIYEPSTHAVNVDIKRNNGSVNDGLTTWTNDGYTFTTTGFGSSGNECFKFDANTDVEYTISLPSNIVVRQFILKNFHANYSGGNGQLKTVSSEGATVTLPTYRTCVYSGTTTAENRTHEGPAYDLVVNIENHVAGTPIVFTMLKSAQPMGWIQLVTEQVYEREFTHTNLNTLCFPYSIYDYSGATFYTILNTEVSGEYLTKLVLEEHVGTLEAGVPYFYDPTSGDSKLVCYYEGSEQATPIVGAGGLTGLYADNSAVPEGAYVTVNNELYKCGSGVTMGEYRAYIDPSVGSYSGVSVPGRRRLVLGGANMPTGIDEITNYELQITNKVIRDGQLLIIRGDKTYNAQGQLVR